MFNKLNTKFDNKTLPLLSKITEYHFTAFLGIVLLVYLQTWPFHVSRPFTMWVALLVIFLPGIWRAGRCVLSVTGFSVRMASILAPGTTIALWMAFVHLAALAFHNFYYGFIAATSFLGLVGYIVRFDKNKFPYQLPDKTFHFTALVTTFITSLSAIVKDNGDRVLITGHFSITEQMLNGFYPPLHLTFPEYVLPYHYGVDIFFAMVATIFALPVNAAATFTTIILWFYSMLLFGYISTRFFGEKAGSIGILVCAFACGFPVFYLFAKDYNFDYFTIFGKIINFGIPKVDQMFAVTSMFFPYQHPWTIGLPIFLSLVIVYFLRDRRIANSFTYHAVLALFLFILGLSNTTLFVTSISGLLFCAVVQFFMQKKRKEALHLTTTIFVSIIGFVLFSGAYAIIAAGFEGAITLREAPINGSVFSDIVWNINNLGLLGIFAVFGLIALKKHHLFQIFSICMIIGGMVVYSVFVYKYSWDIQKFLIVSHLLLVIVATGGVMQLRQVNLKLYRVCLVLLCFYGINNNLLSASWEPVSSKVWVRPQNELDAISWLRNNANPKDLTLYLPAYPWGYNSIHCMNYITGEALPIANTIYPEVDFAVFGGISTLRPDWGTKSFPFPRAHLSLRKEMANHPERFSIEDFARQGVKWVIVDVDKMPGNLSEPLFSKWKDENYIKEIVTFGNYHIHMINPL